VSGIPGDPRTFYMGTVGGGVWKTTNSGTSWTPLTDAQQTLSMGAIAVAVVEVLRPPFEIESVGRLEAEEARDVLADETGNDRFPLHAQGVENRGAVIEKLAELRVRIA